MRKCKDDYEDIFILRKCNFLERKSHFCRWDRVEGEGKGRKGSREKY